MSDSSLPNYTRGVTLDSLKESQTPFLELNDDSLIFMSINGIGKAVPLKLLKRYLNKSSNVDVDEEEKSLEYILFNVPNTDNNKYLVVKIIKDNELINSINSYDTNKNLYVKNNETNKFDEFPIGLIEPSMNSSRVKLDLSDYMDFIEYDIELIWKTLDEITVKYTHLRIIQNTIYTLEEVTSNNTVI